MIPVDRQEMNRTGEQSRESSLGRERSSPHPSATGESAPPLTTARLENGGEGQAPSPSKQQKGNSIPLSVMVNISSYMEPDDSSGMIPMNVLGFLWEAAKEAKRRDEIVTLPIALLSNVIDFISDRRTYNAVALANKELYQICKTNKEKPWPTIRCRPDSGGKVRCFFSTDSQWMYQLRDSKIRRWNIDSGPSKRPLKITNFDYKVISANLRYLAAFDGLGAIVKVYELGGGSLTTRRSFLLSPDSDLEDNREDMGVYKVIDIAFSTSNDACVIQCQIFNDDVGEIISSESTFCVYDLQSRSLVRTLGNAIVYYDWGFILLMTESYILWRTISNDDSNETTLQLWEYNKSDHWIDLRLPCHDALFGIGYRAACPTNDRFLTLLFNQEDPDDSRTKLLRLVLLEFLEAENYGTIESFRCTEISMAEFPFSFNEIEFTIDFFGWFPDGRYQFYVSSSLNPNAIVLSFDEGNRSLSVVEPSEQSSYHRRFCQLVSDFMEEVHGTGNLDVIHIGQDGRTMTLKSSCGLIKAYRI